MTTYLPIIIEVLVLLAVLGLAAIIAAPIRRRTEPDQKGLRGLAHYLTLPALVVVLTPLLSLALRTWPDAGQYIGEHMDHLRAWEVFWVGVLALALLEALAHQIVAYRGRDWPVPDLLEDILRAVLIMALAFVVLKLELGWDIGPLLASTALLTAVLGFALQGVLGNLLAGMSLHLTRTVKQGDWIAVAGVEGRIKRTNWRETRLRTVDGHEMVVPNSQVSDSVMHNLNHPNPTRRHRINVGASYSDEPDEVIAALVEAAAEVDEVLDRPAPEAIVTTFEDYGINYQLRFWSRQYHRRLSIEGQVNRRIWYKFKRRGIEIPFPMSDKLLNDFMTVVYNQRKLEIDDVATARIAHDLAASQLGDMLPLEPADYARLAPSVRRELYTHGEVLMRQGEPGDTFHVLVSGALKGTIDGDDAITFEIKPGAVVGEMSLLNDEPRGATIVVAESADIVTFDRDAFVAMLELGPEVPERLADLCAERLAQNRARQDEARQTREQVTVNQKERAGVLKRLLGLMSRR